MGVLVYPTKCKGIFAFEFGETVFIEEFKYSDWQAIAAQSKLVDMNDYSNKAKRPELPVLTSVGDLVACDDNFLHLAERHWRLGPISCYSSYGSTVSIWMRKTWACATYGIHSGHTSQSGGTRTNKIELRKIKARTDTSFNINYRKLRGAYFAIVL
jgi:hypothetical protein